MIRSSTAALALLLASVAAAHAQGGTPRGADELNPAVDTSPDVPAAAASPTRPVPATAPPSASASGATGGKPTAATHRAQSVRAVAAPAAGDPGAAAGADRAPGSSDRIELGTTEISGNRELPKLMYIVPWQRAEVGKITGRPPNSLVDEVLTPIDRTVFARQNDYYAALQAASASGASQSAGAGAPPPAAAARDEK